MHGIRLLAQGRQPDRGRGEWVCLIPNIERCRIKLVSRIGGAAEGGRCDQASQKLSVAVSAIDEPTRGWFPGIPQIEPDYVVEGSDFLGLPLGEETGGRLNCAALIFLGRD